ncbi:MAG: 50S ribosomal protein L9 [Acidobacteria bacterium]|nr:50S ribosomal protein L9 [Acidobacteriota bacterium]
MELILREDIPNLGQRGDVVRVSDGYGRNYLLPRKLAVAVTEGNRKVVQQEKAAALRREVHEKSEAEQLAGMLNSANVSVARKAGETGALFGSVTSMDVTEALARLGFQIDRRKILLENPIKQLGEYQVPVRLHREVTASVTVQVVPETEA